jgi:hypothetical protein
MSDLTYLNQGFFTVFFPQSKAGEVAWNELAIVTQGTGKIPTIQLPQFLANLREAGYSVHKVKNRTAAEADAEMQAILDDPIWDDPILANLA